MFLIGQILYIILNFSLDRYTQNDSVVYAIVLEWPANNVLILGNVQLTSESRISILGDESDEVGKNNLKYVSKFHICKLIHHLIFHFYIKFFI